MGRRFTSRRSYAALFAGVTAFGLVGALWGVNVYKDAAGCNVDYVRQKAAVDKIRAELATQRNAAADASRDALLDWANDLTVVILDKEQATIKDYQRVFLRLRKRMDPLTAEMARVDAERAAHPLPEVPEGCRV